MTFKSKIENILVYRLNTLPTTTTTITYKTDKSNKANKNNDIKSHFAFDF